MLKLIIASSLVSFRLELGVISSRVVTQMPHEMPSKTEQISSFQVIEQPLWIKAALTVGGLGLIGLELWWFLLSKPKSQKAQAFQGIQEVTITVDSGNE